MAKQKELFLTKEYRQIGTTFASSDGTTVKTIFTAGADDSRITLISVCSSASADADILLYLNNGTTDYLFGHVDVPANAGFNGTVNQVNGMNRSNLPSIELNSAGMPMLALAKGNSLRAGMKAALASGASVTVIVTGEDF